MTWPDDEFSAGETVPIDVDEDTVRVPFDGDEIDTLGTQQKLVGQFLYSEQIVKITVSTVDAQNIINSS